MTSSRVGRFVLKTNGLDQSAAISGAERVADDLVVIDAVDGTSSKETWRRLVDEHDSAEWVQPVLYDDDGHERYPTGELTVRFEEPPTDAELDAFSRRRDLLLQRRNAYQPAQVVLVPEQPRNVYLPELCADLENQPGVARAWPNTRSQFTRV